MRDAVQEQPVCHRTFLLEGKPHAYREMIGRLLDLVDAMPPVTHVSVSLGG